ncbi:MAG: hypothetical protein NWE91_01985 [Candidatus Bathyarchaeota archaeon]|nr:hypothetical protein [Candidatus Bathyarchaeota archaeon]
MSDSIQNVNGFVNVLLEMAKNQGDAKPESSLIVDSLSLFIKKNDDVLKRVLDGLKGQEGQLFIVFSKLTLELNNKNKRRSIQPLLHFIVTREAVNSIGVEEVYDCLLTLNNQRLSTEIIKETSQFLNALEPCAIVFSVKLCSEFADQRLLPQMLKVLDKSMKGYYDAHHIEIERRLCRYFGRIRDRNSFPHLMKLLKLRYQENPNDKSDALSEILNSHPYLMDDLLDMLYDARQNKELVNVILRTFEKMEKPPSAMTLLSKIHIKYWWESPARFYVKNILVKGGESSKPALFDMLRDDEKHNYALECLKEIGVSTEELSQVFPKPPMVQIYNFLYSQARGRKMHEDLNTLWMEKEKLRENILGTTDKLEHLVLHLLCSFNFVTLNVAPLKLESVDIVGFYPETLDLLIISCTTGVLKDDLAKLDAMVNEMESEMPDLFDRCTLTPVAVCSKDVAIAPSDLKYSREQGIAILQGYDIDKLLEMLNTNRKPRQVLRYIEECKWKYVDTSGDY